jgi:sulfur relay (sulfurtransferase) complex TusBCD TusD component (DsrE family)
MLPQDIAALQRAFPELNVVVTDKVNHPHAMSAAWRVCSEEWVLRSLLHYNNCVKGTVAGNKAYIVDIGANYVRHVKKNRFNIHCCVPCIDVRDSACETERVATIRVSRRIQGWMKKE